MTFLEKYITEMQELSKHDESRSEEAESNKNPYFFARIDQEDTKKDKWVSLLSVKDYSKNGRKGLKFDEKCLNEIVENFKKNKLGTTDITNEGHGKLPFFYSHPQNEYGARAEGGAVSGWVVDMRNNKGVLQAKVEWTEKGKEKIKNGEYKFVSVEVYLKNNPFIHQVTGEKIINFIDAIVLTNEPQAIGENPIELSFKKMPLKTAFLNNNQSDKPQEAVVGEKHFSNFCTKNMNTIVKMLEALKKSPTKEGLSLFKEAVNCLSSEEQQEVEKDIENLETTVKEAEKQEAEKQEAEKQEAEKQEAEKEAEKENLAKQKMTAEQEKESLAKKVEMLSQKTQEQGEVISSMVKEKRDNGIKAKLSKLSDEGKITPAELSKWSDTLIECQDDKFVNSTLELLSERQQSISLNKVKGHGGDGLSDEDTKVANFRKEAEKLAKQNGTTVYEEYCKLASQ